MPRKKDKESKKSTRKPVAVMAIRKEKGKDFLIIRALNEKRFKMHGFGVFLKNIKPGDILASQSVIDTVKNGRYRSGVCPMEIFNQNTIGFCTQWVPIAELSVHSADAKKWFEDCCVVRGKDEVDKVMDAE